MAGASSALAASGGTAYVPTPTIKSVKCAAGCMSGGRVRDGGKVTLRGSRLSGVTRVVFTGPRGPGDDASASVRGKSDRSLTVAGSLTAPSRRLVAYAGEAPSARPKPFPAHSPPAPPPNRP